MKKFFMLIAALASFATVQAEDVVSVVPQDVKLGANGWEDTSTLSVNLNNDTRKVNIITMELLLPKGIEFDMSYDDAENGYACDCDENNSRFQFKNGPKVNKTGHTVAYNRIGEEGDMILYKLVMSQGTNLTPIQGTSGKIFDIYYTCDANMTPGYYPIIVRKAELIDASNETKIDVPAATSYVKVGNPENATLALEGEVPSFVNEALASETAIGTLDLTKATASNGTFTYVDGRKVIAPEGLKGKVAYKRSVSGLASICLPFAADLKAYTYTEMAGEYAIFDEVSNLAANTPAIVNANIDITVADATIGSVEGKTINSGYYLKGGKLCKVNGSAKIAPLRGCWDITAPVKGFKFNDADAILTVDANANEDIFNLNGVKLNKAQRGVNIIGGKKVMK